MSLIERGRFSSKRKRETVLLFLRGEDLDLLSRGIGVTGAALARWRDTFLEGGVGERRRGAGTEEGAGEFSQGLLAGGAPPLVVGGDWRTPPDGALIRAALDTTA
jgi:hypothetical protein